VPYLSASAVVIHYEEALYQVYAPFPLPLPLPVITNYTSTISDYNRKEKNLRLLDIIRIAPTITNIFTEESSDTKFISNATANIGCVDASGHPGCSY